MNRRDLPLPAGREEWLQEVAAGLAKWFRDLDFPVPPFRVTSGFPSSGRRGRRIAGAWPDQGGQTFTIFVRPDADDAFAVAAAITLQLARLAAGEKDRQGLLFRHLTVSVGLRGRKTESPPGALFRELARPILTANGPMPKTEPGAGGFGVEPKQRTRLLKVACGDCGYVVRVAQKWLDLMGPPHCPRHGEMQRQAAATADET